MEALQVILTLLFVACLILLIIGFFQPDKSLFWLKGNRTKVKSSLIYGIGFWVFIITLGSILPEPTPEPKKEKVVEQIETKEEPEIDEDVMTREDSIKGLFSAYSGENMEFTIALRSQLNDPDSYDHIRTTYMDLKDSILWDVFKDTYPELCGKDGYVNSNSNAVFITCYFRAKNPFNALVKSYAHGILDVNTQKLIYLKID